MLPEYGKQRLVVHTHTEILVTHFLCREIGVAVAYVLICFIHTHTDFVKHTVALQSDVVPSGQTICYHTPQFFLHVQLATKLCYFSVNRDTAAHDRYQSPLLRHITPQVK